MNSWIPRPRRAHVTMAAAAQRSYNEYFGRLAMSMMSKDRVEFDFPLSAARDTALNRAFQKAFSVAPPQAKRESYYDNPEPASVRVRCRPSQFARFLIYRNEEGGTNGFKCLNPKLVQPPAPVQQPLDVSGNPA